LEIGGTTYADHDLGPGSFFGESALLDSAPRAAHFMGKTDGFALSIDQEMFTEVLGDYKKLITKSADKKRLVCSMCCGS
jgi:CRP-like cAMP-binding protein